MPNITTVAEDTSPLGSDLSYGMSGGATDFKRYLGDDNLLPDGYMYNGTISVTVASNNITVALKTKSGGNPSATDPVTVWINGAYRRCTAALSVTKNAGTNWFGSGGSAFATIEQDYFVYLIWNTTPATDILDIGFARIPYGRVYSEFSGTSTAETYLAFGNASTPTSTDNVVNVGRFAATLSATAAFNWSVPTFTNVNKIDAPWYETRELTYVPTWASTGTAVALGNGTITGKYKIIGREFWCEVLQTMGSTTTYGTGSYSWTMPFTATTISGMPCWALDSGTAYYTGTSADFGANNLIYVITSGNSNIWGQTLPHTWANADTLNLRGSGRL